ncbi:MAG: GNAT family N-acetyltransferase [Microbacterium sp.]|jgi:putative acetyltransferase|uniref:GNAT family N-acetyltransferase n=1 Tax=Microbacterium sp. TaxID=51671 RepID=UPI0028287796|nr:GNAT family N-acetyltransferase [Microbacterium sp.]MDR2320956.1 GNAT family N-acetyltransferase [Microbacterium sp.]
MPTEPTPLIIRPARGAEDYPRLVEIWRSAVRATHDFLADEDFARIEGDLASVYLPAVTLEVAERDGRPVGFAGVAEGSLEMLFVADEARGSGVGTLLLQHVIENLAVTRVDVNEQNTGAHGFYLSRGFTPTGRSELDGDGRPYPILHLARSDRGDRAPTS